MVPGMVDWKELVAETYGNKIDIPENPTETLFQVQEDAWKELDWDVEIDGTDEELDALADAAAQFHQIHLSHVMIFGDIVRNVPDVDAKRLGVFLALSRMRDVDAWGRYLGRLKQRTKISEPVMDYFKMVFNDDHPYSRLIGLVYVDVFREAIDNHLQHVPEKLFRRIMERGGEEAERNVELSLRYLREGHQAMDAEEREKVVVQTDRYLAQINKILRHHADTIEVFGGDVNQINPEVNRISTEFQEAIANPDTQ